MRTLFLLGAAFALIGVAAGAFGTHALAARLAPDRLATFETAIRYQMYHAFALLAVGLAGARWPGPLLHVGGWLFVVGVLIFSGTVYALALGSPRWLGAVTPVGGLCLLAGWLCVIAAVARS